MFGDAIFPYRKHEYAIKLRDKHGIRFLSAVEYPDALVEVDLAVKPSSVRDLLRSDRTTPVKHAFYTREKLTVLVGDAETILDEDDVPLTKGSNAESA